MNAPRHALLEILADGATHSGAALGARLGMSRAAVAKHVARLRDLGWAISARPGAGYALAAGDRPLDRARVEAALGKWASSGARLELLHEVESTSAYAAAAPAPASGHARICLAEVQTAGRGRRGRTWRARPGAAITFTVDRLVDRAPAEFGPLALAVGVALAETLSQQGIADVGLKWPNDLVHDHAKLGGILVEVRGQAADRSRALVGVGVNHGRHPDAEASTSVTAASTGEPCDRSDLAGALAGATLSAIEAFEADGGAGHRERWSERDVLAGRRVRADTVHGRLEGTARGVAPDGALLLQTPDGREQRLHSAEVSVRGLG